MTTKRVLVLGGTSYVAQFICKRFFEQATDSHVELACTIRASPGCSLPQGFQEATEHDVDSKSAMVSSTRVVRVFTGVSLLDTDSVISVIEKFMPTVIINCVAMSSPAACERDPEIAKALNQPMALIAYLRERPGPAPAIRYLHFSTDFVYDGQSPPLGGYREQDAAVATKPQGVYSATKLAFDTHLQTQDSQSLHIVVLRIANIVGARAPFFHNQPPKFAEWLFNELVVASANHGDDGAAIAATPVRLWSDEVRSFLFVDDLVHVVWELVYHDDKWSSTPQN